MKVNKDKFLIRIITFPLHLVFMLLWQAITGIWLSFNWLFYGAEHIIFMNADQKSSVAELIRKAEQVIERLENDKN